MDKTLANTHNNKKRCARITALMLAVTMSCTALPTLTSAKETENDDSAILTVESSKSASGAEASDSSVSIDDSLVSMLGRDNVYSAYLAKHSDAAKPKEEVVIQAADYSSTAADATSGTMPETTKASYEGVDNCLVWTNHEGDVTYTFNVSKAGLYNLEMYYFPIWGDNTVVDIGILIDGEYPFLATQAITLDRYWKDETAIKRDSKDNDLRPTQTGYDAWITYPVKDKEGLFNDPYFFYLSEGEHTLTIRGIKVNTAFKSFTFKNYDALTTYESIKPTQAQIDQTPEMTKINELGTKTYVAQAENPLWKSSSTLYATYDRTSYMTSPSNPTKQRYNTIGDATWDQSTQTLAYEISVDADGYYRFSVKARQKTMRGMFTNRRIYIDGAVPCDEMNCIKFRYDPNWYQQTLQTESGEDIYIYLTAGKHTIAFEAVPGDIGEIMNELDDIVYTLNYYYRRILMITGPTPDEFKDYFIYKSIPTIEADFTTLAARLRGIKASIEELTGAGSEAAVLETMAVLLDRCVKDSDEIPQMVSSIKDNISAVSSWMRDYRDQPLELDYIEVATAHEDFFAARGNFFSEIGFSLSAFFGSFFEDYTVLSEGTAKSLNVWVSLGRDQATVVKELVDSDFNANSGGIEASINLVQGSILEATLAGKGPEIALFTGGDQPIQFAARDLLVDLTGFKDYQEVTSGRFTDNLMTLYSYRDGVYGLPISQNFPMMFYRTDILAELGITEIPETWDEFIDIIPILQRSYLEIGLLSPTSNLSSSVFDAGDTFIMLLLQQGLNVYDKELTKTTFDTQEAIDAFTTWTKFYTVYDFEQTYDAFTRFRTGEMPIVIQNYVFYNQLSVAAPEIKGLWDFAVVPGTVREDGTVSHAVNSGSAGAVIFQKVSDTQAAWTFLKWFTSTEVQVEYGRTIEALMGPMGRFDTANLKALEQLPWSTAELKKIQAAQSETVEVPIIPASYATTRHVKNAFRAVVNDTWTARYALSAYNRDINSEIERKNTELETYF